MVNGRTLCFGNISLLGVILSYRNPKAMLPGSGFNPTPPEVGQQVHERLVEMLRAGRIRPLVGKTVPFVELPAALDQMEDRATVGRVVIQSGQ